MVCFASPPFVPVYLCTNVELWGATCHSACPVLHHSESCPLGLSVHEYRAMGSASGQTACPIRPTLCQSESPVSVPPRQRESSPPRLPVSAPPTSLNECLFFISLAVGLPCCSILCQFWLCEEAQCVYLRRHLGSPRLAISSLLSCIISGAVICCLIWAIFFVLVCLLCKGVEPEVSTRSG